MASDHPLFFVRRHAGFWATAFRLGRVPELRWIEIPLAYWLAISRQVQSKGVFWAIAEGAIAAASAILFKQGRWKKQKI